MSLVSHPSKLFNLGGSVVGTPKFIISQAEVWVAWDPTSAGILSSLVGLRP